MNATDLERQIDGGVIPGQFSQGGECWLDFRQQGGGDEVGGDACLLHLSSLEAGARESEKQPQLPGQARQEVAPSHVGEEPDGSLGHGEEGPLRRDAEVAMHGDPHPAPHGDAVDERHVDRPQHGNEVVEGVLITEERLARAPRGSQRSHVPSRAERPATRASQHHRSHGRIRVPRGVEMREGLHHPVREGVQGFWAVQGCGRNTHRG
mmetsp:Transcript_67781/g.214501  ORF Transcript_67781/g.214501 Transcript_67781/m.214501 type:complete len:208 (-) Transcript_67781:106-729(-)